MREKKITIVAMPKDPLSDTGTMVIFNRQLVARAMNVTEAFMVLGGLLAKHGPTMVEMVMDEPVNPGLRSFYETGRNF